MRGIETSSSRPAPRTYTEGTGLEPEPLATRLSPFLRAYLPDEFYPRATRRSREPPSDAEIERSLREKAVSDSRAAEILLRWLQRVRPPESTPGVDLDALSEAQLERLHAGLVKLASLDETVLAALVQQMLTGDELASSS